MRFGSVCSGIEAASVAFNPLGWEAAWLAETDVPASAVLAHRYGASEPRFGLNDKERKRAAQIEWGDDLVNWGDMTCIPDLVRSGEAEAPDVLCGGTPCQSYSIAGRREGLDDERGQLTLKFVEIADEIDNARARDGREPCIVFWENVPGVLTDAGNAFGNFLADLAGDDEPLEPGPRPEQGRSSAHWTWQKKTSQHRPKWPVAGVVVGPRRTVSWRRLDAQYFGLAQRRARVLVVASARVGFYSDEVFLEFDGVRRDSQPSRQAGQGFTFDVAPCLTASGRGVERVGDSRGQDPVVAVPAPMAAGGVEPDFFRLVAFGDYREDSKSSTIQSRDHKYVTDIIHHPGNPIVVHGTQDPCVSENLAFGLGRNNGGENVIAFDTTQLTSPHNYSRPKPGDPCHPLAAAAHAPAICFTSKDHGQDASEELAPTMRAMGHTGSHANGGGQLAACIQDDAYAFQPRIARNGRCDMGDLVHALTAESGKTDKGDSAPCVAQQALASTERGRPGGRTVETNGDLAYAILAPSGGSRTQEKMIATPSSVRRLMPVECERLQGFPDGHTLVPVGKKEAADGPRYKQLGNSWPVNVIQWIGGRIGRQLGRTADPITLTTEDYTWLMAP